MQDANRNKGSRGDGQEKPKSKAQQWVPKGGSQSATMVPSPATASERVQPTSSTSRSSSGPVTSGDSNSREQRRGWRSPDLLAPLPSDNQDASAPSQRKKTRKKARNSRDTALTTTTGPELTSPTLLPAQTGDLPSPVLVHHSTLRSMKRRNNKKNTVHDATASSTPPPAPTPTYQQDVHQPPQEFYSETSASSHDKNTQDATATSAQIPPQVGHPESKHLQRTSPVAVSASGSQLSCSSSSLGHTNSQGHGSSDVPLPKKRSKKKKIDQGTRASLPPQVADSCSLGQADIQGQDLIAASQTMKRMNKKKTANDRVATSALVGAPSPGSTSGSHMESGSRLQPLQSGSQEHSTSTTSQRKKRKRDKKTMPVPCTPSSVHIPKTVLVDTSSSEVIDSLKLQVLRFLNKCKGSDGISEFYMSQVDQRILVIDFYHLLYEDKELAFSVCNGDRTWSELWLSSAAHEFFKSNGVAAESTRVHVVNMPNSIANAKDMLNSHSLVRLVGLFHGKEEVTPLTLHGRTLFDVIQCGLIDRLLKGDTWFGLLSIEDYVIIEEFGRLRAIITKPAAKQGDASPEEKALDVNGLWPMMEPFYVKDGVFPLFFKELMEDLTTATGDEVSQTWFMEYLRFHPAIVSSMTRRNLVANAYHVARKYNIAHNPEFQKIFCEHPMEKDWRRIACSHPVLLNTYNYKRHPEKKVNASQEVKGEVDKVMKQQGCQEVKGEGEEVTEQACEEKVTEEGCQDMQVEAEKVTEQGVIGTVANRSVEQKPEEAVE